MSDGVVRSINIGMPREQEWAGIGLTSIDKHPVDSVFLGRLGPVGDQVSDTRFHGGPDQAVYGYAREDLDWWEEQLGRSIRDGQFGENLTTTGIDVNAAEVGERWQVGEALLEVALVRTPCNDFKNWQRVNGYDATAWVKRFTAARRPGPYLRVLGEGEVRVGDPVEVRHRPGHGVTVAEMFTILNLERSRLPELSVIEGLAEKVRRLIEERA